MLQEYVRTVSPENFENPVNKFSSSSGFSKADKRRRKSSKSKRKRSSESNGEIEINNGGTTWSVSVVPSNRNPDS